MGDFITADTIEKLPQIVNGVLIGILVIFALISVLRGVIKGFLPSVIRLGFVVVSLLISLLLFSKMYGLLKDVQVSFIQEDLPKLLSKAESIEEIYNISPTVVSLIPALIESLFGPICFVVLFVIVKVITSIISLVINICIKAIRKNKPSGLSRLGGVACALVSTIIVIGVLYMPVVGYVTHGVDIVNNAMEIQDLDTAEIKDLSDEIDKLNQDKFVGLVSKSTDFIFIKTSTVYLDKNTKFDVYSMVNSFIEIVPDIQNLGNLDFSDVSKINLEPILQLVDDAEDDIIITRIMVDVISFAGDKWYNGEAFFDVNIKEQLPEEYADLLDDVILKLKNTTAETFSDDIHYVVDTVNSLAKTYSYVNSIKNGDASTENLQENLTGILSSITDNTKDIIADVIDKDLMQDYGLTENQAEVVADIFSIVVQNVSGLDEELVSNEATAITNLMSYTSSDADLSDVSPSVVIDEVMNTQTVKSAIKSYVSSEDAKTIEVTAEQKRDIGEAIKTYELENSSQEDFDAEVLNAIKSLFDIQY